MTYIKKLPKKLILLFHNGRKQEKVRHRIGLLNTEEEIKNREEFSVSSAAIILY